MNIFTSAIGIILVEALVCLVILILSYFLFNRNKKKKEHHAADEFINKITDGSALRGEELGQFFNDNCEMEPKAVNDLIEEIASREKSIYQKVISMFLNRDSGELKTLNESVQGLSEPYCQVIANNSAEKNEKLDADQQSQFSDQIMQLKEENSRLAKQLQTAMQTMDEISSEYTRIFNGTKSELELQNSCKKMLQTFQDTELQIRA